MSRLEEVIGEESVSSFARRSGIGESVIRGYLTVGKRPRLDHLVSLSDAGNVTVDWLATGREPKDRTALKSLRKAALKPPEVSERCVIADTLPCRETFLDCAGELRVFELTQNMNYPGAHIKANEVTPNPPGYRFEAWADQPAEAIARVRRKIRGGLARRYLAENPEYGLCVLNSVIAGRVGLGGLVVDGKHLDWAWIENYIQTNEGWLVEIRIKDPAE